MNLQKNENNIDRVIRVILAIIFAVAGYLWLTGTLQIISYVLAVVMLITALTGFCALYKLFGISTNKHS